MTLLNLRDAKRIWVGQNEAARSLWLGTNRWDKPAGPLRTKNAVTDNVVIAGHSSLIPPPWGTWTGDMWHDFGQSSKELWELASPHFKTATSYDAIVVSEVDDIFGGGLAMPDSPQGLENLQYLYWIGLTAKAKGCTTFAIYQAPSASIKDNDASNRDRWLFYRQWLETHLEMPVWLIHSDLYISELQKTLDNSVIYRDSVHMAYGGPENGLWYLIYAFLTGVLPTYPPEDEVYAQAALYAAQRAWWTGLAGSDYRDGLTMADPLPAPLPLPGGPVEPEVPATDLHWTATEYIGPAFTIGNAPTVVDNFLRFDGGGRGTNALNVTDELYFGAMVRINGTPSYPATIAWFGGSGEHVWMDPFFSLEHTAGNGSKSDLYLLSGGSHNHTGKSIPLDEWVWVEYWFKDSTMYIQSDSGIQATPVSGPWTATGGLSIGKVGTTIDFAFIAASAIVPSELDRAALKAYGESRIVA